MAAKGATERSAAGRPRVDPMMRNQHTAPSIHQLTQVATATLLVAGAPVGVVWWLRASGAVSSAAFAVILGMVLSLCASAVGRLVWEKRTGSEDMLFSELMIWGFLHRWHTRRRLASAFDMVAPLSDAQPGSLDGLSAEEQAKLLEQLVAGMETRDPYLHGHSRRVARHSWMIARRLGLPREEVARIRTAAAVHDVGKIETPKAILHKAGPLTDDEYDVIKRHPGDGARMAAVLRDTELTAMVRHHHERLDGTGYPDGLAGEEIPLGARIIAVADTFDAVTSARPYRSASPHKRAIDILKEDAGTRLDPAVVRAFCGHYAGREPLALWSFVASIPDRLLSWLGAGAASVTSAAKLAVVAAIVGGVAATSAALGVSVAGHRPAGARVSSMAGLSSANDSPGARTASAPMVAAAMPSHRQPQSARRAHTTPSVRDGGTTGASAGAQLTGPGSASGDAGPATASGSGEAMGNDTRESAINGGGEQGRGSGGEGTGAGKSKEGLGTSEEAQGNKEESATAGKREEAHGKNEEAHGRNEESATAGTSEEAHGKSEESASAVKAEAPHGKSEEAHGEDESAGAVKGEEVHGKSATRGTG
jgi:hypothetical protein